VRLDRGEGAGPFYGHPQPYRGGYDYKPAYQPYSKVRWCYISGRYYKFGRAWRAKVCAAHPPRDTCPR
jgi:hypothetical protein